MKQLLVSLACLFALKIGFSQALHSRWDELTATDWPLAMKNADSTCILPIGVLEKHGPHVPIGSDLIKVREWAAQVTKKEYAVVFPDYFYGQINEAKQQPGTFALPSRVVWDMLDATCDEIARNGFKKIVIVNGHGGNPDLIHYFLQTRLEKRRNYAIYFFQPPSAAIAKKMEGLRKSDPSRDQHAGESETSVLLDLRPDLVQMENAEKESGSPQKRLNIPNAYTPIWWYADYPNHYAGEGAKASKAFGSAYNKYYVEIFAETLKAIKADKQTLALQEEFYDKVLK